MLFLGKLQLPPGGAGQGGASPGRVMVLDAVGRLAGVVGQQDGAAGFRRQGAQLYRHGVHAGVIIFICQYGGGGQGVDDAQVGLVFREIPLHRSEKRGKQGGAMFFLPEKRH